MYIANSVHDYRTTVSIQQQHGSTHATAKSHFGNGRAYCNVLIRCLLNKANLRNHRWGELAATAVFLINRVPDMSIGRD